MRTDYPAGAPEDPVLHKSLLHCLQRPESAESATKLTQMLDENFRMNNQLSAFAQTLYGPTYRSANGDAVLRLAPPSAAAAAAAAAASASVAADPVAAAVVKEGKHALVRLFDGIRAGKAMFTVMLPQPSDVAMACMVYEEQLQREARAVVAIVSRLWTSVAWGTPADLKQRIFVLTPHRVQRTVITRLLCTHGFGDEIQVDTVERMQGREAEVTLLCYGFLDRDRVAREADFLLNRSRLNVSMTRARKCCILVCCACKLCFWLAG